MTEVVESPPAPPAESEDQEAIQTEQDVDLDAIRGDFNSLNVLLEQLHNADMKVITTNPLRIWKHEGNKPNAGWKPDTTQFNCGAKFQISQVMTISGVSGKGWNESSEYIMGRVDDGKWIRLINFRGLSTAVPDMDTYQKRINKVVEKIAEMESKMTEQIERRSLAEQRMNDIESRVSTADAARETAEARLKEFEANFRKMEALQREKEDVAKQTVDIAKREALEAKVLMRYFEDRMADSEKNYTNAMENIKKTEVYVLEKENQAKQMENTIKDLEERLEVSERARRKLELEATKQKEAPPPEDNGAAKKGKMRKSTRTGSSTIRSRTRKTSTTTKKSKPVSKKAKKEAKKEPEVKKEEPPVSKIPEETTTEAPAETSEAPTDAPTEAAGAEGTDGMEKAQEIVPGGDAGSTPIE